MRFKYGLPLNRIFRGVLLVGVMGAACLTAPPGQARLENDTAVHPLSMWGKGPQSLYAIGGDNTFIHDVGLLKLRVSNIGTMGNRYEADKFGAAWLGGEYLFVSGLWIAAVGGDSQKHVSTAQFETELLPEVDDIWTVYKSFEGVQGGKRVTASDPYGADDDNDGLENEDFLDGFDNDGDDPGDGSGIDEDYEAISSQMFSCIYRDDTPEALAFNTEHFPLNLLIRQRSFQWSAPELNEFVGFEFEIVNDGDQSLQQMYIGFFSDSDAGPRNNPNYFSDDLVGWGHLDTLVTDPNEAPPCDNRLVSIDAAFMWDAPDDGNQAQGGDVPGVFGSLFLGHTTDPTGQRAPTRVGLNTVAWFSSQGEDTDPRDDIERYDLMSRGTRPSRPANKPEDYRYVISAGEFSRLGPGESLVFQTAYVIGNGFKGFAQNAVTAQRVFDGAFIDRDENPNTGINGRERCLQVIEEGDVIFWTDECDTTALFPETYEIRQPGPCIYVDDDCNDCTGVGGKEYLSNWVGITPPPPPNQKMVPGNNEVVIRWDNSSQNHLDPFTGNVFFAGYEIWRCDTWDRPEGSVGPDASEFKKIMTLWYDNACQGISPPSNYVTNTSASAMLSDYITGDPDAYTSCTFEQQPVGYYQFIDDRGVTNGVLSFYVVTAFAIQPNDIGIPSILGSIPSASEEDAVLARASAQTGEVDCDAIFAVPNPYYGSAAWDLQPNEDDPTGTKIGFVGMPEGSSTIRIYTMAGDLVKSDTHEGTRDFDLGVYEGEANSGGTYWWDLITQSGQDAVSGIYLFTVEHDGGTCRGRFVVIR